MAAMPTGVGVPTSSLAEWGVVAEEDLGVPALEKARTLADHIRQTLTVISPRALERTVLPVLQWNMWD
jgi:hypothetical protein